MTQSLFDAVAYDAERSLRMSRAYDVAHAKLQSAGDVFNAEGLALVIILLERTIAGNAASLARSAVEFIREEPGGPRKAIPQRSRTDFSEVLPEADRVRPPPLVTELAGERLEGPPNAGVNVNADVRVEDLIRGIEKLLTISGSSFLRGSFD